jgi:membrane-associated phospholipid phosphatase
LAGACILTYFEKGDEILYFNSIHTPFFNWFFLLLTKLAEVPVVFFVITLTLRVSYGKGLMLGANSLLVFLVTTFLKSVVFANEVRPSVFFEGKTQLNFINEAARYHSFPSGHTSSAFALFFMLSILTENKKWGVFYFVIALLIGVSRVYLMQHFFRDVYAGSFVAVLFTTLFYLTFVRSKFYNNLPWKDKALFK